MLIGTRGCRLGTQYNQLNILLYTRGVLTRQSNLANTSSLLWHAYAVLPAPVNWAGFYVRDDKFPSPGTSSTTTSSPIQSQNRLLLLGPFHGKPACQLIHFGRGVCGTAAQRRETVLVSDVLEFPGHIACDAESRSEVVVPVVVGGEVCPSSFPCSFFH